MDLIEIKINNISPTSEKAQVLIALSFENGASGIVENENDFSIYFENSDFEINKHSIIELLINFSYTIITHKPQNWNEEWESNFPIVNIDNKVIIHAPFHNNFPDLAYKINISPKMAFGIGHHYTTKLIIQILLKNDLQNKRVLDMGSGTGILSIMSEKLGAIYVYAIDNDINAYNSIIENIELNKSKNIEPALGDAQNIKNKEFDIIIANITRNIILQDMNLYSKALVRGGLLILSGFMQSDINTITNTAKDLALNLDSCFNEDEWAALVFKKN